MVAGVGLRPLAQVLRNSLSRHPPTTGHETLSRVRTPGAPLPVKPLSHKYSTQKIFRIDDRHVGIIEVL